MDYKINEIQNIENIKNIQQLNPLGNVEQPQDFLFEFNSNQDDTIFLTFNNTQTDKRGLNIQNIPSYVNTYEDVSNAFQEFRVGESVSIERKESWKLQNGVVSEYIKDDLNKLCYAKENGLSAKDMFAPKYKDETEAANNINVGDICRINNSDRAYIKLQDGSIMGLNISCNKYLELFPPVERYSIQQKAIGDCYLVSSLDALYKNPSTRADLLNCITENDDGSITIKYPGSDTEFTVESGKKTIDYLPEGYYNGQMGKIVGGLKYPFYKENEYVDKYKNQKHKMQIQSCEGLKMLEHAYGEIRFEETINSMKNKIKEIKTEKEPNLNNIEIIEKDIEKFKADRETYVISMIAGGSSDEVFEILNIIPADFGFEGNDRLILTRPDIWDNYVITGGAESGQAIDDSLIPGHMYSIKPFLDENNEMKYEIINPWNSALVNIMNYEDLEDFRVIQAVKINDNMPDAKEYYINDSALSAEEYLNQNSYDNSKYDTAEMWEQKAFLKNSGFDLGGYETIDANDNRGYFKKTRKDGNTEYLKVLNKTDTQGNVQKIAIYTHQKNGQTIISIYE